MISAQTHDPIMSRHDESADANERLTALEVEFKGFKETQQLILDEVKELKRPRATNWTGVVSASVAVIVLFGTIAGLWINSVIAPLQQKTDNLGARVEQVSAASERERTWIYSAMEDRHQFVSREMDALFNEVFHKQPEPYRPKEVSPKGGGR